ncbi:hypothetical protein [Nostoc sp. UHCC 0870]|uniref:hypothetical protein n=1 Tax=Nostoc sp. UHCC 0870 TaxID=2914041 RepID=UPI001EDFBA42|nr:hypothetical protein [Nostoc sp. UHCC 0870]UKO96156.1 hypothetical protein L6494_16015 [Nostoc sp. UHCC 0870]
MATVALLQVDPEFYIAIAALTAALTVRTREALPQDWAMTQNNLASAYCDRIAGRQGREYRKGDRCLYYCFDRSHTEILSDR